MAFLMLLKLVIASSVSLVFSAGSQDVAPHPQIVADFTEPINKWGAEEISRLQLYQDYIEPWASETNKHDDGLQPDRVVYYSVECGEPGDCFSIAGAVIICSKVLFAEPFNASLVISLPFEPLSYTEIKPYLAILENVTRENEEYSSTIGFPIIRILLRLKDSSDGCQYYNEVLKYKVQNLRISLSVSSKEIESGLEFDIFKPSFCKNGFAAFHEADFNVCVIPFSPTVSKFYSFGLYQRTIDTFYTRCMQFLSKFSRDLLVFLRFRPLSDNKNETKVQDMKHIYLFSKKWAHRNQRNIIFPQVSLLDNITASSGNINSAAIQLTASITGAFKCRDDIGYLERKKIENIWMTESVLTTIIDNFPTLIFSHAQWTALKAQSNQQFPINPSERSVEVIINFSNLKYGCRNSNWTKTIQELLNPGNLQIKYNVANFQLRVILLSEREISKEDTFNNFIAPLAQHVVQFQQPNIHHVRFGCIIELSSIYYYNEPVQQQITSCNKIDVKAFVLKINFDDIAASKEDYSFAYFSNTIYKQMMSAKEARQLILKQDSGMIIYLQFEPSELLEEEFEDSNIFCKTTEIRRNEYYEAILNWAQENQFRLISKAAVTSYGTSHSNSWMSYLRLFSNFSMDTTVFEMDHFDPLLVIRNLPKSFNGWEVDSCISWLKNDKTLNFKPDIFHDINTGVVVNLPARENPYSLAEVQTMILFIAEKFFVAEIVGNHITALALSSDLIGNLTHVSFFVCYQIERQHQNISKYFKHTLVKSSLVKGVHLEFNDDLTFKQIVLYLKRTVQDLKYLYLQANYTLPQIGFVGKQNCLEKLNLLINGSYVFFDDIDYILCKSPVKARLADDMSEFGKLLDTHLYIHRVLKQFRPSLSLLFQLDIQVDLGEEFDKIKMSQYLRLISTFQMFAVAYNIQYFIVNAFDHHISNGWWMLTNKTDLTDVTVYIEREAGSGNVAENDNLSFSAVTVLISVPTVLLILIACLFSILLIRYNRLKLRLTSKDISDFQNGTDEDPISFNPEFELSIADLSIDKKTVLGEGTFGTVYAGTVKTKAAAIKKPNNDIEKSTFKEMLVEVNIHCHLGYHPNLVKFLGAYVKEIQNGFVYIATGLCSNGSLDTFLRKKKPETSEMSSEVFRQSISKLFFRFAFEIASGMEHLVCNNIVHCDLAARNILLDCHLVCKISDFGLSRKLNHSGKYIKKSKDPLPWKWMAYESLVEMEFSSKSDMWSYGVTLWEIFSFGMTPYDELKWSPSFVDELKSGLRLPTPTFATENLYDVMLKCWDLESTQRPSFPEVIRFFNKLCVAADYASVVN